MTTDDRPKLLIIDALPVNLLALDTIIEQDELIIFHAESRNVAMKLLLEHDFALVILNSTMTDRDGFRLTDPIFENEKNKYTPILIIVGTEKELRHDFRCNENRVLDFLYSPLDIMTVKHKVNMFLALSRQRTALNHQIDTLRNCNMEMTAAQLELERTLKLSQDFISMVAHELRTPLSTLFLEKETLSLLLAKGDLSVFNEERLQKMVSRQERQLKTMSQLIDNMVEVSHSRSEKLSQ